MTAEGGAAREQSRICPECGYDLRVSLCQCPECGLLVVDRRHYLAALHADIPGDAPPAVEPPDGAPLILLRETRDCLEAEWLHEQLLVRKIPCRVEECDAGTRTAWGEALTLLRISVAAEQAEPAWRYLCEAQRIPAARVADVMAGRAKVIVK